MGFTGGDFIMGGDESTQFNTKNTQFDKQVYIQHASLQQWGKLENRNRFSWLSITWKNLVTHVADKIYRNS